MKKKLLYQNEYNRINWVRDQLQKIAGGESILDAGAGEQQYKKFCTHLLYVSQDFAQYDGLGNKSGLQMGSWEQSNLDIISDITKIPRPDSSFDNILCTEVFEHLSNPILAIKEFSRLIKKGGKLIITAPFCSLTHFAPFHYYSGFNKYFYKKFLEENNFEIIEMIPNGNFFQFIAQELTRIKEVNKMYTDQKMNLFEKLGILFVLKVLEKLNNYDKGSSEILNFGWHVVCQKK